MVFHIPFNGREYLMFKCRRCGWCCDNQKQGALLLTLADIKRLTKHMGYSGMTSFLNAECVWAETKEPKEVFLITGQAFNVKYAGYYLKRFAVEDEITIQQPRRCRFLTDKRLCQIQEAKPTVCTKFPYIIAKDAANTYHAYYANVHWSDCQGYRAKKKVKLPWLIPWVKPLIDGAEEVYETMKNSLMQIIRVEATG
jgi:Fe-S-cluster containining protein